MVAWKRLNSVDVKELVVSGYPVTLLRLPSGWISLSVPMGKTADDKAMFDYFVYHQQNLYNGKSEKILVKNLSDYIYKWKRLTPAEKKKYGRGF